MKLVLRMRTKDMTELKYIKRAILIVSIILLVSFCFIALESATAVTVNASGTNSPIIVEFAFPAPELTKAGEYDSITMVGLDSRGDPGMPILPFKTVKILIPQGEGVQNIELVTKNKVVLDGFYNIECGQIPVPISYNTSPEGIMFADNVPVPVETMPNQTVYASTNPFPGVLYSEVSAQDLRGYNIFVLNLYPVQYIPKLGEISYFEEMEVIVSTTPISKLPTAKTTFRDLPQDQARVLDVIDNPSEIDTYSTRINTTRIRPTSIVNPADSYEYVIITNSDLKASFLPLVNWKNQTGVNTTIITVDQITSEPGYSGTDTQAEIRNFIFDAYTNWETEYVLLGGDDEIIPYRGVYIYAYGSYYDYDMPCDMYYGALDGNWDNDGDGIYGEGDASLDPNAGGTAGEEADLYAEVYVGRATVDTASEATNFVNKIVDYEQHPNATYLNRALMVGEYLGWGGIADYGGNYKDEIADYIPQYTITTLYKRDSTFSDTNVITHMNAGTHIVNHMGHANQDLVMGLSCSEIDALTNTKYFLVYSQGCYSNAFDEYTSGSSEAVSEHFIFNPNGAFAYIGNTRYGWGVYHSTDGPSQEFDRGFFDALSNERIMNVGHALQDSKEDLIGQIGPTHCMRWCYFTLNLLGDPETEIVTNFARPFADIKTPKGSSSVANIISITGTAKKGSAIGSTFQNYTIEYGFGTNPTSWSSVGVTLINDGSTEVVNDTLAIWDTSAVSDGTYTLNLSVTDTNGAISNDWVVVIVDNVYIITPQGSDFFRGGDIIIITGTANGTNFQNYTIEYGLGKNPTSWSSTGINLSNDGTISITNGTLAEWNTSSITAADYYTIKLKVNNIGGYKSTDNETVVIDPAFQVGWPQSVSHRFVADSVAVGDIDGDGDLEIIAGESRLSSPYGRNVYAWHHDGTNVSGWPQVYVTSKCIRSAPALGDIDGDIDIEILVGTGWGEVEAWHHEGSEVTNWPVYDPSGDVKTAITLGDIDNDGDIEIVAGSCDYNMYAWHHDGSLCSGFPITTGSTILASPALGDIDNDGDLEIIVGATDHNVYVWHHNGSTVTGWPKTTGAWVWSSPALGDIDGDGDIEIVVGSDKIYAWHHNGSNVTGWPKVYHTADSSPALGDIDGDGDIEIVIADRSHVHAFHNNGSNVTGWPKTAYGVGDASPILGDIDGDGDIEILVATDIYSDKFYAWHHDGSNVSGWPKIIPTYSPVGWHTGKHPSPVLADIDTDGDIEVILGDEGELLVWDLNGTYNQSNMEWPMFQYDVWHTGLYGLVPVATPPKITAFAPQSPVNDTICNWRIFNVTVNQTVSVSWFLDDLHQQTNESVREASFKLHAVVPGEHNVTAEASNVNGVDTQSWVWNVTELSTCEGTNTSCGMYPNCENCNEYDGCYVYGNGCEERDYYCESNEVGCNYSYSNRHTDYHDAFVNYCKGDEVWKRRLLHNFSCYNCSCTDHTSWVDDQLVENCSTQCTANNTLKTCNDGNCTDTGICNTTICGADATCEGKMPGEACGDGKICNSTCNCVLAPPIIFSAAPESPVNDSEGAIRTFNVTINQTVNVSWQINGTVVQTDEGVTEAAYTNTSAVVGTWNVSVIVNNVNGTDMQMWVWTVEPSPCFIATAAYGTPLHEDIDVLRDFRDEYLMTNIPGRAFVKIYYSSSPPLADAIRANECLGTAVRSGFVKPVVHISRMFVL